MPTLETWDTEEVHALILEMLPEGWRFICRGPSGEVAFETATGERVWETCGPDPHLDLLNAYGWLVRRSQQVADPRWATKAHTKLTPVKPLGHVPDPEDLDPAEIEAVYAGKR